MNISKIFSILMMSCFLFATALADEAVHGVMMVVKGDIKVTSGKDKSTDVAKVGKKVFPGDTITAGPDSRAKIVMTDKNVINISPDSKITIEKYTNTGTDKNVELKVEYGKIRASVEQKYDGEKSKFNVKTPSAVAGVRGTDFLTSYNAGTKQSQVITFTGTVAMGTPGPGGKIMNPVFVQPGQTSSSTNGKAPDTPRAMPAAELNQMKSESSADTASAKKSDSGPEKKDAKKDDAKKDDAKKDDAKKDSAKKDSATGKSADSKSAPAAAAPSATADTSSPKPAAGAEPAAAPTASAPTAASGPEPASAPTAPTSVAPTAAAGPEPVSAPVAAPAPTAAAPPADPGMARAPSSLPPIGGGSMITGNDLPTAPGGVMPSMPPPTAGPMIVAPTVAMPPPAIPNTFINNAIQNQKSNTTIIITK